MSEMFEHGLDMIEESNNTIVRYMNHRVDEITDSVNAAMHDEHMMEFAQMAVGLPLLGLGLVSMYICFTILNPNHYFKLHFCLSLRPYSISYTLVFCHKFQTPSMWC